MGTDFSKMSRLPRKMTPGLVKYLWENGHVDRVHKTPYGTVIECDDYVSQATPEELEEQKCAVQRVAARLLRNLSFRGT